MPLPSRLDTLAVQHAEAREKEWQWYHRMGMAGKKMISRTEEAYLLDAFRALLTALQGQIQQLRHVAYENRDPRTVFAHDDTLALFNRWRGTEEKETTR